MLLKNDIFDVMPVIFANVCKHYETNSRGVYNELELHSNTQQLLALCIASYLPSTAFMQQ
jgi:hypothetical protein